jgi:hypothetical protein
MNLFRIFTSTGAQTSLPVGIRGSGVRFLTQARFSQPRSAARALSEGYEGWHSTQNRSLLGSQAAFAFSDEGSKVSDEMSRMKAEEQYREEGSEASPHQVFLPQTPTDSKEVLFTPVHLTACPQHNSPNVRQ